jgi:hypothetical protein
LAQRPLYLVERDSSGEPASRPKNLFSARLKLVEVLSGSAKVDEIVVAEFITPNDAGKRPLVPTTPPQVSRNYVVVIYTDDSNQRRLAGFPIAEARYQAWIAEVRGFYGPWGEPKK